MTDVWLVRRSPWGQQQDDARGEFDIDYGRVVHSGSFRRLQGKTQILNLGDSDFYRTRLTHSLEVAQIAGGVSRQLAKTYPDHPAIPHLPPLSLIQTAGFCHDLGHPPFGHGGEVALNYCMRSAGGFEGNGQTLRILARLENFSREQGADLTRRSLLSILKYPAPFSKVSNGEIKPTLDERATTIRILDRTSCKPPKCYFDCENDVVDWILEPLPPGDRMLFREFDPVQGKHGKARHKSFDCSIMDQSDDIAYGVHDLEDAVALGLVDERDFREHVSEEASAPFLEALKLKYGEECGNDVYGYFVSKLFSGGNWRKRFIGRLVHHFVTNVEIVTLEQFAEPLVRYRARIKAPQRKFLDALQDLIEKKVIFSANVQHLEYKGQKLVVSVFEAFQSDPKQLLPSDVYARYEPEKNVRVICDYVAGMTDDFLLKTYDRLFSPRMGSVFDRL
ncbi:anti-phage deoxyguanosine triphosphatase [Bradyrhizobium sp. CB1717]|uniref:anti-phage deoxyguanosine triphosphatase n=1 Tax=Bradyrhizobium sp. CB1717 TaxID=3039154 RepID=UPI0024B277BE|nr:anti-phage deoxyguanosine triphosphatase [Bradyrhizobium sp. CB1717]WFU23719.1 anti-phage deoxyguanosine triphosphatase [Bradyrhizobium sp. CB1717]